MAFETQGRSSLWCPSLCSGSGSGSSHGFQRGNRTQSVVFSELRTCAPACGVLWSWIQTALHCVVSHPCCSSLSPSTRRMGAATNGPAHGEGDTAGGYIRLCVPGLSPARVTFVNQWGFVCFTYWDSCSRMAPRRAAGTQHILQRHR